MFSFAGKTIDTDDELNVRVVGDIRSVLTHDPSYT